MVSAVIVHKDPILMSLISSSDKDFLATTERWIHGSGEVFVTIRYSCAAGNKSFEFFTSVSSFGDRLRDLPPRTSVIVFREPQLPLRGLVGNDFINQCLSAIPNGAEFLVLEIGGRNADRGRRAAAMAGETHTELREALEELRGLFVAAGLHPAWWNDTDDNSEAFVPDENGVLTRGIY
jgi:hypothetical protein